MTKINDGGPAFPSRRIENKPYHPCVAVPSEIEVERPVNGMSLRDWFAGRAMAALISARESLWQDSPEGSKPIPEYAEIAEDAFNYADAMLAKREKQ